MAKKTSKKSVKAQKDTVAATTSPASPSERIDERIAELGDWRGKTLARVRALIRRAEPRVVEEWKWRGVPVWSHAGQICTGETYKDVVKLTFHRGASLADPARLFNAGLQGNARRAIDLRQGDALDARAFQALVRSAVELNTKKPAKSKPAKAKPAKLLSGGNPQIAKADGDAPVQAFIEAMPGWKRDVGRRLDALIVRTVPGVKKAVRWNTPFYGMAGRGWFLGFHCMAKYVKVAFLRGNSLRPMPPVESKSPGTRYFHIHEGEALDERLVASWIRQASKLPGEDLFPGAG